MHQDPLSSLSEWPSTDAGRKPLDFEVRHRREEWSTAPGVGPGKCPSYKKQVVIVQPHVSELIYQRIRQGSESGGQASPQEQFRLRMLETLLHSARAAIVALGADLYVIGSKT
jgi:hypothetical protein